MGGEPSSLGVGGIIKQSPDQAFASGGGGGAGDPLPWAVAIEQGQPRRSAHAVGPGANLGGHWVGPSPILKATP